MNRQDLQRQFGTDVKSLTANGKFRHPRFLHINKDRQMTVHHVRSWMHFFDAIESGNKTHDLRKDDRNYQVGDQLILERYDNVHGCDTGGRCTVDVTYITDRNTPCAFSSSVLPHGYCILSIQKAY